MASKPITLAPIATSMINKALLDQSEIEWLNDYHQRCFEQLSGYLSEAEVKWLKAATQAI